MQVVSELSPFVFITAEKNFAEKRTKYVVFSATKIHHLGIKEACMHGFSLLGLRPPEIIFLLVLAAFVSVMRAIAKDLREK